MDLFSVDANSRRDCLFHVSKQFLRFVIIGVLNTFIDLLILNIFSLLTGATEGFSYAGLKAISFMGAVIFSYIANKHWAFKDKSKERSGRKFTQFIFISIMGMLINVTVATIVVTYCKVPVNAFLEWTFMTDSIWVNLGALSGSAIGMMWNFIGYKFFVFESHRGKK